MRRAWWVIDLVGVLTFVIIGRSTHHHGLAVAGVVSTTWPFAVGLVAGWLLVARGRHHGSSLRSGCVVWLSTVVLGMVVRVLASQGTAIAFIVVALCYLGAVMLGGRALVAVRHRTEASAVARRVPRV